jgi:hypothetical protein
MQVILHNFSRVMTTYQFCEVNYLNESLISYIKYSHDAIISCTIYYMYFGWIDDGISWRIIHIYLTYLRIYKMS